MLMSVVQKIFLFGSARTTSSSTGIRFGPQYTQVRGTGQEYNSTKWEAMESHSPLNTRWIFQRPQYKLNNSLSFNDTKKNILKSGSRVNVSGCSTFKTQATVLQCYRQLYDISYAYLNLDMISTYAACRCARGN